MVESLSRSISASVDRFSLIGQSDSSSFVLLYAVDIRTNQTGEGNADTLREKATRILAILKQADGLTRDELVERSELTCSFISALLVAWMPILSNSIERSYRLC